MIIWMLHVLHWVSLSLVSQCKSPFTLSESERQGDFVSKIIQDKTVLLRERKRYTDRRLSSTPCADLVGGTLGGCPLGWGTPVLTWLGGHPPGWVLPHSDLAPLPWGVDRQTPLKIVPYRRTTYAVGNNYNVSHCLSNFTQKYVWNPIFNEKSHSRLRSLSVYVNRPQHNILLKLRLIYEAEHMF